MTTPAQAAAAIQSHVKALPAQLTALTDLAGAILREPIVASRDQPPFDRVTMDGIAIASNASDAGRREFRIAGIQAAGSRQMLLASPDACFEVMTGAVLPRGCDAVIPIENITIADGVAKLGDQVKPFAGMYIHARGLDCHAGSPLLEAGTRLRAPEVAVIASTGLARVMASRPPRIMVISTGDELKEPGDAVEEWQIYRSNAYGVLATLKDRGFDLLAHDHLPDDLEVLRQRLQAHLEAHDVLILSGGVSMGKFDYVPQVLGELGIETIFHKVEQRPGRPLWFGVGASGTTVYALPGNPVSTLVCLVRYVLAGLAISQGAPQIAPESIALAEAADVNPKLTLFQPVRLLPDAGGGPASALVTPTRGSGDFTSLIGTTGFVELAPGSQPMKRGTPVPLYRW